MRSLTSPDTLRLPRHVLDHNSILITSLTAGGVCDGASLGRLINQYGEHISSSPPEAVSLDCVEPLVRAHLDAAERALANGTETHIAYYQFDSPGLSRQQVATDIHRLAHSMFLTELGVFFGDEVKDPLDGLLLTAGMTVNVPVALAGPLALTATISTGAEPKIGSENVDRYVALQYQTKLN